MFTGSGDWDMNVTFLWDRASIQPTTVGLVARAKETVSMRVTSIGAHCIIYFVPLFGLTPHGEERTSGFMGHIMGTSHNGFSDPCTFGSLNGHRIPYQATK